MTFKFQIKESICLKDDLNKHGQIVDRYVRKTAHGLFDINYYDIILCGLNKVIREVHEKSLIEKKLVDEIRENCNKQ